MKIKTAFTLAEVLVTLMIIGVIAAMTIPGLRKNAELREMATGCRKAYSTLAQAINLAEQENGPVSRWSFADADTVTTFNKIKEYLNITKECINSTGCLGDGVFYQLDGAKYASLNAKGYGSPTTAFITADGMSWTFDVNPNRYCLFFVDVNGAEKKPNTLGYDVFYFLWYPEDKGGFYPSGKATNSPNCTSSGSGIDCAAKVIREGKISY